MLIEILRHIKNFFSVSSEDGTFQIENNILTGINNKPLVGQFFALTGSVLNDGVYKATDDLITLQDAADEVWDGTVYLLRIPRDFLTLVDEIKAFNDSPTGAASNITSASFGIQAMSFATDASGNKAGWESVFRKRLDTWRRYTKDIDI